MSSQSRSKAGELPSRFAGPAIEGYVYQFDLTILELLRADRGSSVVIEGLEDVDVFTENAHTATQVKYLSSARYSSPKVLREPLMRMLDALAAGKDCRFILHVHFGDDTKAPQKLDADQLREALTIRKRPSGDVVQYYKDYNVANLARLVEVLEIRNGDSRDEQRQQVVLSLAESLGCELAEVQDMHYASALAYVQDLAMSPEIETRTVTRARFLEEIDNRASLYTRWHQASVGAVRYTTALARRLKSSRVLNRQRSRAIVVVVPDSPVQMQHLVSLICNLATQSYGRGKLTTTKPWTVVLDADVAKALPVKRALLERGIVYADGFEDVHFVPDVFMSPPVINTRGSSITNTSFDIRVVRSESFSRLIDLDRKFDALLLVDSVDERAFALGSIDAPINLTGMDYEHINLLLKACA